MTALLLRPVTLGESYSSGALALLNPTTEEDYRGIARLARWSCVVTVNGPYTEPKPKEGSTLFWWPSVSLLTTCPMGWSCEEPGQVRKEAALTFNVHVRGGASSRSIEDKTIKASLIRLRACP